MNQPIWEKEYQEPMTFFTTGKFKYICVVIDSRKRPLFLNIIHAFQTLSRHY